MALSAYSGPDVGYKGVVQGHVEAGMRELVCFAQYLLETGTDPDAYGKIRERIMAASQELSAAEEELGRQLKTIDTTTEELVAAKKSLQDEQKEEKESLDCLRIEMDFCHQSEREAREMLATANSRLEEMQAEVQRKQEEAANSRRTRDIGIGLMFIPIVGTVIGATMVGCGQVGMEAAEKAADEAQATVNRYTDEAARCLAEVNSCSEQEQEMETEIAANEERLDEIEEEQQMLTEEQQEIAALQNKLRKCVTFVKGLAGKVHVADRLTKDVLIFEELGNVLGDMVQHVLPLMSPGGESGPGFLAAGEIQGLIEKLKSGSCGLRALADTEEAASEF